jgi:anti-sigma-K factor RskA
MTDPDPTTEHRRCGDDVAAYALGALEATEVDAFRRHLDTCTVCRDELAAFQEVVDALPMTAPAHRAPADLRRRVLREVESEPRAARELRREPRARPRGLGWLGPRPALAFGTALALAVLVFAGLQLKSSPSTTRVVHAQVTGRGTADLRLVRGHAELVVHHFSPPPSGEIYEVWLKRAHGGPIPTTALFSVTAAGEGDVEVPGNLRGVVQVMVTPEPAGGSPAPTHPAVLRAVLT